MRSSWEASATKRRSRCSDAVRSSNASSIWPSIAFRAPPRRPTSVSRVVVLDALREVAARDRGGRLLDPAERPQADPDEPEAEHEDRGEHRERDDDLDQEQLVQGVVDVVERGGDDERSGRPRVGSSCTRKRVPPLAASTVNGVTAQPQPVARATGRSGCGGGVSPGRDADRGPANCSAGGREADVHARIRRAEGVDAAGAEAGRAIQRAREGLGAFPLTVRSTRSTRNERSDA